MPVRLVTVIGKWRMTYAWLAVGKRRDCSAGIDTSALTEPDPLTRVLVSS